MKVSECRETFHMHVTDGATGHQRPHFLPFARVGSAGQSRCNHQKEAKPKKLHVPHLDPLYYPDQHWYYPGGFVSSQDRPVTRSKEVKFRIPGLGL